MTDYICLWKEMLNEHKLLTKYDGRCTRCDGHDLLCVAYVANDECSALEGFNPYRETSGDLVIKILRAEK